MLGSAPFGGLQTIYNIEAGSAPSRGHQQSLSARKDPLRGARSCPTCWGSPVRSALSLPLIAHYPPFLFPSCPSGTFAAGQTKPGKRESDRRARPIQPVRPSSKTLSSFRTKLRITGRPRSLPPSWRRRRAPEPPSRKPSSSPSCPDSDPLLGSSPEAASSASVHRGRKHELRRCAATSSTFLARRTK